VTTEWDNTPWAGTTPTRKAVFGPGLAAYQNGYVMTSLNDTPQAKAAACLRAYKVGWFHKAGRKIANDVAGLDWSLSDGDAESEDPQETVLGKPDLDIPWEALSPVDQLQRLLERPNPAQTGRQLILKTQIRVDFGGAAFWYLENAAYGLPSAIYGISPSRMWPSRDKQGAIIGWVMDRNSPSGGVPFEAAEILVFSAPTSDDDDVFGVPVVEAVYAEVPLTELMAKHTADVLTTGGRLAGAMWPKDRALDEAEFQDAQKAWRSIASDPNAAKRLLLFPEPMEWAAGASTPAEIGIPDLATLNRDTILTAFPISPYQLGVPTPGGLNSGEVRREDRRDYWEGTIHPRVDLLEEVIQVNLVSRYEQAMGRTFDFDFDEPNLDDASGLTEKAGAFKALVNIGLDPKESLKAAGLGHIKWTGLPAMLDPAHQAELAQAAADAPKVAPVPPKMPMMPPKMPAKAARAIEERDAVVERFVPQTTRSLRSFFETQQARIAQGIRDSMPKTKAARMKADPDWWDASKEDDALRAALRGLYVQVGRAGLQTAADGLGRIIRGQSADPIVNDLIINGGARIAKVNLNTKDSVVNTLAEGTRRGYSIPQLIDGVAAEGYAGVLATALDNGTPAFGDARAEMIARTETRMAYNRAAVLGYKELGVEEFLAYDGDEDLPCQQRNGQTFSAEQALEQEELEHPNGTLTFSPVVDKAWHDPAHDLAMKALDLAMVKATVPEPDIHIHNDVRVPDAPPVIVNTGEVHVAPAAVHVAPTQVDVHVTGGRKTVKRDDAGRITEIEEA
jgi:phage portal protein BeeE